MIFAALSVVTTKNVVHAALWLVIVLAGVAAQYILAAAEFVAVSQVLVYIGAVMVLFLFGIMLTRAKLGGERGLNNPRLGARHPRRRAAVRPARLRDARRVRGRRAAEDPHVDRPPTDGSSATSSSSPYLLPFLALSFVLLAAAIGAIVLARKD